MLSRFVPLARSASNNAARWQVARCMSGYAPTHWKTPREVALAAKTTMDDLPVPQGDWQANYNKINAKWNMYLVGSVIAFFASAGYLYKSGSLFLNTHPKMK